MFRCRIHQTLVNVLYYSFINRIFFFYHVLQCIITIYYFISIPRLILELLCMWTCEQDSHPGFDGVKRNVFFNTHCCSVSPATWWAKICQYGHLIGISCYKHIYALLPCSCAFVSSLFHREYVNTPFRGKVIFLIELSGHAPGLTV